MIDGAPAAVIVLGCAFTLGAIVGQWDTARVWKRIYNARSNSLFDAYQSGFRDGVRRSGQQRTKERIEDK